MVLAGINCLIFTPDEKFIISGSSDFSIKAFDVKTKQQVWHIKDAHRGKVSDRKCKFNFFKML